MTAAIYTAIAEKLAEIGGIDDVGVVSAPGRTAILFAGSKTITKYIRGPKKQAIIFQISGMDTNDRQQALISRLTDIVNTLESAEINVDGIMNPTVSVNNLPVPTVHNSEHWIYTANIEITFNMKG